MYITELGQDPTQEVGQGQETDYQEVGQGQ